MHPDEALRVAGLLDVGTLHELTAWLSRLRETEERAGRRHSPRIRDLHQLALRHYFHPRMGGRTSIKVVLPAVWEADAALRRHPWFAAYNQVDAAGRPLDPYETLPAMPLGGNGNDAVREGTGAIRMYQEMIFAPNSTAEERETRRRLLLQYCKLDTLGMLAIWRHWLGRAAPTP